MIISKSQTQLFEQQRLQSLINNHKTKIRKVKRIESVNPQQNDLKGNRYIKNTKNDILEPYRGQNINIYV